MKKKFTIVTLGCRTNQYESQGYAEQLAKLGYERAVGDTEWVDLCIVNTCTVTKNADHTSKREISKLAARYPDARIVVTGCMVEKREEEVRALAPSVIVVPNQKKEQLVAYVFPDLESYPEFKIEHFDAHTRAFVKVQDGCNSFCTYCIIPYVRGRSRSRPMQEIVREVEGLIAQGYREVVLTGINIGDFDGGGTLADLVKEVDQIEGLYALRISSIDPDEVDDRLLRIVLEGKTTCPSMHVVLQSGSNVVLKRMNRKYTKQMFLQTARRLYQASPDFTLTTDVIVGFPGESERDFEETKEVIEEVGFAKVHMFPYSPRERTKAFLYPNRIAEEVMKQRKRVLLHHAETRAHRLRNHFIGRTFSVLFEGVKGDWIEGHTPNFLKVAVPKKEARRNEIKEVVLVENREDSFVGRVLT
jgi:threonylcarbamoyladenosine tRNA methylthiotransferase MtaB